MLATHNLFKRPTANHASSKLVKMPRILQKWDAQTHEDILLAFADHFSPKSHDWRAMIGILREQGHTFSEGALQYVRLLRLCRPILRYGAFVFPPLPRRAQLAPSGAIWWRSQARYKCLHFLPLSAALPLSPSSLNDLSRLSPQASIIFTRFLVLSHSLTVFTILHQAADAMTSKVAPTVWDHDAHLALLQAVMAENPPSGSQWDSILTAVAKKGYVYTASAAMYLPRLPRLLPNPPFRHFCPAKQPPHLSFLSSRLNHPNHNHVQLFDCAPLAPSK